MGRAPEEQPVSGVDHSKPLKTAGLDVFDAVALVEYHVVIAEPGQRGKSYNPADLWRRKTLDFFSHGC